MVNIDATIEELISIELKSASEVNGTRFNSKHEAHSVITEEIEEVDEDILTLKNCQERLWGHIRHNEPMQCLRLMREKSRNLIKEAVQVAAMIEKYKRSFKE